jgi:hypothetical protein
MKLIRHSDGVTSAAAARMIPLQGGFLGLGDVRVPGAQGPSRDGHWNADWDIVSPHYFQTVGMPIVEGRTFQDDDRKGRDRSPSSTKRSRGSPSLASRPWVACSISS